MSPNKPWFTKTFAHFAFAFALILGASFLIIVAVNGSNFL